MISVSALGGAHADPLPVEPIGFVLNYDVKYAAFGGDVTLELLPGDTPNEYSISATTRPRGLAKMFAPKQSTETAEFTFVDGQVVSHRYTLEDGTPSEEKDSKVNFDWDTGSAYSVYEQEIAELPLGPDVYDRISADVVVMLDQRNGKPPRTLYIVEKNQIREYTFEYQGEERIDLPQGPVDTVKYLRQRTGSSRSVMIWYAPELEFLPVRMEQLKRGKTQITFETTSYSLATRPQ